MRFTDHLWRLIAPIYDAILALPFNRELTDGTLDLDTFRFYVFQDARYLADFARALAIVGSRAPATEDTLAFLRFAEGAVVVERALHERYFDEFGVPEGLVQSPTCAHYTNFLLAAASHGSHEAAVAALLPCFWIYREVGNHIATHAAPANRYQRWIDTYSGEDYAQSVDRAIAITDAVADRASDDARAAMRDAFVTSSRLEWMFWDGAYRRETWPP
jgi:thiaminase/transcriptional activator TenA